MVNGQFTYTGGGQLFQYAGLSPSAAELAYGLTQLSPAAYEAYAANKTVNSWVVANADARASYAAASQAHILEKYGDSTSKFIHVFDDPTHALGRLVTQYGSPESAFVAVDQAAQQFAGRSGVVTGWIDVGGTPVWVRGTTIDGTYRVGTFSGNTANAKYPYPGK